MKLRALTLAVAGVLALTGCGSAVSGSLDPDPTQSSSTGARSAATPTPIAPTSSTPSSSPSASALPTAKTPTAPETTTPRVPDLDTSTTAAGGAAAVLATLPVKGRAPKTGYTRDQFGARWADTDRNGCDTRNDVLGRDLTTVTFKAGTHDCKVATGDLADPYTATAIAFTAGASTSSAVQIDHVVALSNAWQTGAQQLSATDRRRLANDPLELLAVDGKTNTAKGDGDAATWLPPNTAFRCAYVARQIAVKATYRLWVTAPERAAMTRVLTACPDQQLPTRTTVTVPAAATAPAPAPRTTPTTPAPTPLAPSTSPDATAGTADATDDADDAVGTGAGTAAGTGSFGSCAEARAAGVTDIPATSPRYSPDLDRDGDGIACEAISAPEPAAPAALAAPEPAAPAAYYPNCSAARAAGAAPLYAGQAGYRSAMDGDGDGVACE